MNECKHQNLMDTTDKGFFALVCNDCGQYFTIEEIVEFLRHYFKIIHNH